MLTGFISTSNAKNLYKNEEYRFRITFPEGWKIERGSDPNIVVIASDITGLLMNIHIAKANNNATADMLSLEMLSEMREGLESDYLDMELLDKSVTSIGNKKALMMEFSGTYKHVKNFPRFTRRSYFTVYNGYAFTINCGSNMSVYKNYKKAFVDSVSTLVFEDDKIDRSPVGTTKESPVDYKKLEYFVNSIKKLHPGYHEIIYSQKFKDYVNNLPLQQLKTAIRIKGSGTSEEIIQLISNYKLQRDYQESHRSMIKDVIENYSVFDESHAMNILQDWINNEEGNAKVIRLSVEDNSSNRFTQTYLIKYTIAKGSNQQKYMYEHNPHTKSTRKMLYLHEED